jgi:hypothetical protein
MKPEDSSPAVKRFRELLDAYLKDVDGKDSHEEFNATLDHIAKVDPEALREFGDEDSGQEPAQVVAEFKAVLAERTSLLARLRVAQARRAELLELREKLRPGRKFSGLAMLVLGEKRFHRYVAPAIADMHVEYYAALGSGEYKKARIIVWRFYALMMWPVLRVFVATIKTFFEFAQK